MCSTWILLAAGGVRGRTVLASVIGSVKANGYSNGIAKARLVRVGLELGLVLVMGNLTVTFTIMHNLKHGQ